MERQRVRIRFVVDAAEQGDQLDALNRAMQVVQAFAGRGVHGGIPLVTGNEMEIDCVVSAESFDAAASLIRESLAVAKRRDPALSDIGVRVFHPRSQA